MKIMRTLIQASAKASFAPSNPYIAANSNLISSNVNETEYAAWAVGTTYNLDDRVQIVTAPTTVTMTIAAPCVVSWTSHGLPVNTPVEFSTTGTLPTGILAGRVYFVASTTANSFKISNKPNGTPINSSGSQSGTHTCNATRHDVWQSIAASNTGNPPATSPTKWVRVGSTNKFAMFDIGVSSQSSRSDSMDFTLRAKEVADGIAFLNISASSLQVTQTSSVDGDVYNETIDLVAPISESSYYAWFFDPIVRQADIILADLKPYSGADVRVILTDTGGTVLCGGCILGKVFDIGGTLLGMSFGIDDYTAKLRDDFGNFYIQEHSYSRKVSCEVRVPAAQSSALSNQLAAYRAIPTVYIGAESVPGSFTFGFYERYLMTADYISEHLMSIEIKGLI